MTTLQIVMLGIWVMIALVLISLEGFKDGIFLCLLFTLKIGFLSALAALTYYSLVAISQAFK